MVMFHLQIPGMVFCLQIAVTIAYIFLASFLRFIEVDSLNWKTTRVFLPYIASFVLSSAHRNHKDFAIAIAKSQRSLEIVAISGSLLERNMLRFLCANFHCWQERFQSANAEQNFQGPLNGGVSNGGVSRSGLVLPFLSFFVLLGLSWGFSRFARGWSGDFPDLSFSSFSAY